MTHSKSKNLSRHSLGAASNEAGRRRIPNSKFSLPRYETFTAKPGFLLAQVVDEIEASTTAIDHCEAKLDRQITRSNRLRQSALVAAFTGKLNYPRRPN